MDMCDPFADDDVRRSRSRSDVVVVVPSDVGGVLGSSENAEV